MLEISPAKVAHIIIKAREYDAKVGAWDDNIATGDSEEEPQSILEDFSTDAARAELAEFIAGLNEDEQANLVALTWVGRGTYSAEQFDEAVGECPSRDFADDARIAHDDRSIVLRRAFFMSTLLKPSTSGNSGISASL